MAPQHTPKPRQHTEQAAGQATEQATEHVTDPRQARRAEATAKHVLSVTTLLDQRAELRGVLGLADLVHDSVRWAA